MTNETQKIIDELQKIVLKRYREASMLDNYLRDIEGELKCNDYNSSEYNCQYVNSTLMQLDDARYFYFEGIDKEEEKLFKDLLESLKESC